MSGLCIATGWCAHNSGHNNPQRSKLQNSPQWLADYWMPHIVAQVTPDAWMFYVSNCEIMPRDIYGLKSAEFVFAKTPAIELSYRHDWAASITMGAVYAYTNNMDYLYIEQDCLAHNIPAVVDYAKDHRVCYGYGEYSLYGGWAENSLTWCRWDALPDFIARMMASRIKECDGNAEKIETIFHRYFQDIAGFWPFGYGRKRPINFDDSVFYAQQLTDGEIRGFQNAIHRVC